MSKGVYLIAAFPRQLKEQRENEKNLITVEKQEQESV